MGTRPDLWRLRHSGRVPRARDFKNVFRWDGGWIACEVETEELCIITSCVFAFSFLLFDINFPMCSFCIYHQRKPPKTLLTCSSKRRDGRFTGSPTQKQNKHLNPWGMDPLASDLRFTCLVLTLVRTRRRRVRALWMSWRPPKGPVWVTTKASNGSICMVFRVFTLFFDSPAILMKRV